MSFSQSYTPFLLLFLKNDLTGGRFPEGGYAQAVLDTGYDGYLAVPQEVFRSLGLDALQGDRREVHTADGRSIEMKASPASIGVAGGAETYDGMVETGAGIAEILVGNWFLSRFKVRLDYCTGSCKIEPWR